MAFSGSTEQEEIAKTRMKRRRNFKRELYLACYRKCGGSAGKYLGFAEKRPFSARLRKQNLAVCAHGSSLVQPYVDFELHPERESGEVRVIYRYEDSQLDSCVSASLCFVRVRGDRSAEE